MQDNRQEDVGEVKTFHRRREDDNEVMKENEPPVKKYLSVRKDLFRPSLPRVFILCIYCYCKGRP